MKVELQHSRGGFFNQNFMSQIKTQEELDSNESKRGTQGSKRARTTAGGRRKNKSNAFDI